MTHVGSRRLAEFHNAALAKIRAFFSLLSLSDVFGGNVVAFIIDGVKSMPETWPEDSNSGCCDQLLIIIK